MAAMKRRAIILTLAALGFCGATADATTPSTGAPMELSREGVRATIEAKFATDRAKCTAMSGYARDDCVVFAHAERSRTLMAFRIAA